MTKIVINTCFGGFGLSREAIDLYCSKTGTNPGEWNESYLGYSDFSTYDLDRDDPILVEVVKKLKKKANGYFSDLKIVDIPEDVKYYIHEYDGLEEVHEEHRIWS
jgi:hypothetical protein